MALYVPDFEKYYRSELHSDVAIILREVGSTGGCSELPDENDIHAELPGHTMVLVGNSPLWKAQLDNWPDSQCGNGTTTASNSSNLCGNKRSRNQQSSTERCIEIVTPAGQLEIGQQLLKAVYEKQPAFSNLEPLQLLQLVQLADKYDVPKVVACAASSLASVPAADWPWEVVIAVLSLPDSLRLQHHMKQLVDTATTHFIQVLGDLDIVWGDEQLQNLLLHLPFEALLQLLQHVDTQVVTENTVVYSILQWHNKQPTSAAIKQQLQVLLCCVRMQHCSVPYIHTYMIHDKLIRECFTVEELSVAGMLYTMPTMFERVKHPIVQRFPAWSAAKRPISKKQQVLEWQLSMTELKETVERYLAQGMKKQEVIHSQASVLQGQSIGLDVRFANDRVTGDGNTSFAFFLRLPDLSPSTMRNVTYTLQADAAYSWGKAVTVGPFTSAFMDFNKHHTWGSPTFIKLGKIDSWAACPATGLRGGFQGEIVGAA